MAAIAGGVGRSSYARDRDHAITMARAAELKEASASVDIPAWWITPAMIVTRLTNDVAALTAIPTPILHIIAAYARYECIIMMGGSHATHNAPEDRVYMMIPWNNGNDNGKGDAWQWYQLDRLAVHVSHTYDNGAVVYKDQIRMLAGTLDTMPHKCTHPAYICPVCMSV